jgi:hypothetical protein
MSCTQVTAVLSVQKYKVKAKSLFFCSKEPPLILKGKFILFSLSPSPPLFKLSRSVEQMLSKLEINKIQ